MSQNGSKLLTEELLNELNANPGAFEARLRENPMNSTMIPHKHLHSLIAQRSITLSQLIEQSGLSKPFVYQILAGERKPGRDTLIRIALCINLPLEETQRLLALWEHSRLYPRVRRDAAVLLCMKRGLSMNEVSEYLSSIGEKPLL